MLRTHNSQLITKNQLHSTPDTQSYTFLRVACVFLSERDASEKIPKTGPVKMLNNFIVATLQLRPDYASAWLLSGGRRRREQE